MQHNRHGRKNGKNEEVETSEESDTSDNLKENDENTCIIVNDRCSNQNKSKDNDMQFQGSNSEILVAEIADMSDTRMSKTCTVIKSKGPIGFGQ